VYLHPCNEASNMNTSFKYKSLFAALCLAGTAACSSESSEDAGMPVTTASRGMSGLAADLKTAEGMIDAFYSFDPERLAAFLSQAGDPAASLLGYQAWAEGGHYMVLKRTPCALQENGTVTCPVTVRDDPVQALQTGYNVTDVFHLTFANGVIVNVDTSSDDQPIYHDARVWVAEHMPEVM